MRLVNSIRLRLPVIVTRSVLLATVVSLLFGSVAVAAAASKIYTLFEGDNIAVGQDKEVHPVRDVSGGSWVIAVDGKDVLVSANSGPISMKVTPLEKLSDLSVTLTNLKTERSYTYQNDPAVRLTRSISQGAMINAGLQAVASQAAAAQDSAIMVPSTNNATNPGTGSTMGNATVADQTMRAAGSGPAVDLAHVRANDAEGDFDALDVSFEISSVTPLAAPYIVTMTRIHEPASPAGSFRNVVFARALEPVKSNVTKVHFQQAGFPFGYRLEGYEIHVYDRGREVATNLSPKRQVLTFDQAFDYVRSKYLEAHKSGTFPAVPAMGELPADFAAQVAGEKYKAPIFVKVSKDGLAHEVFADAACKARINDPFLESVARSIRFRPAIEQGVPAEGVVALNLDKLRM